MDKKLTKYMKIGSPQNKQTYPIVQTVTDDNTIKHKHIIILYVITAWPVFISNEYWNHIFILINWNTLLRIT